MSKQQLSITTADVDGVTVVGLSGAVDASNVAEFERALRDVCEAGPAPVLVDCSDLTYVNSTSFGLFFKYHQMCEENGGSFAMCGLREKIRAIVDLLGLNRFLALYEDQASALDGLRKKA
jgi:anti-anti-sigma factor